MVWRIIKLLGFSRVAPSDVQGELNLGQGVQARQIPQLLYYLPDPYYLSLLLEGLVREPSGFVTEKHEIKFLNHILSLSAA